MPKVLQIQANPCIRAWKQANALKIMGWDVYLGQMSNQFEGYYTIPTDAYKEIFYLTSVAGLLNIADYFDIIHCHNEPDWWTAFALCVTNKKKVPVVYDCHDFVPGRQRVLPEYLATSFVANCLSDLAVYVSDNQMTHVNNMMGELQTDSIVIENYPSANCIPKELKEKKKSDKIKLVYAGGISGERGNHRFFIDEFRSMMQCGFEVYCYAPNYNKLYDKLNCFDDWHFMGHCAYDKLIKELSQYDIGLLPFTKTPENEEHLNMGLSNKLFEYLCAGLPVACKAGLEQYDKFITENKCGIMYNNVGHLREEVELNLPDIDIDVFQWTMEKQVKDILIPKYEALMVGNKYEKIEVENILTYKDMVVELEAYTGDGFETGFFGRGRDKDLYFESWFAEELVKAKEEA